MNTQTFYIAKSGYKGLVVLLVLLLISLMFDCQVFSYIFLGLLLFWGFIFRNPERNALHISSNAFIAPVDGVIKEITSKEGKTILTLQIGILDVGVLRSPMDIEKFESDTRYGAPLLFAKAKKFLSPKTVLKTEKFRLKIFSQFLHISPLEISHDKMVRGERIGFIKSGVVKVEVDNLEIKVNIGDKVLGGESVLGYLR